MTCGVGSFPRVCRRALATPHYPASPRSRDGREFAGLWRADVGIYSGLVVDHRGTSGDSETLIRDASPFRESRDVVCGCYPKPPAPHKTRRSAIFVSAETAGGEAIGTGDCWVLSGLEHPIRYPMGEPGHNPKEFSRQRRCPLAVYQPFTRDRRRKNNRLDNCVASSPVN